MRRRCFLVRKKEKKSKEVSLTPADPPVAPADPSLTDAMEEKRRTVFGQVVRRSSRSWQAMKSES